MATLFYFNAAMNRIELHDGSGAVVGYYGDGTGLPATTPRISPPDGLRAEMDAYIGGDIDAGARVHATLTTLNTDTLRAVGTSAATTGSTDAVVSGNPATPGQAAPYGASAQEVAGANANAQAAVKIAGDTDSYLARDRALAEKWAQAGLGPYPYESLGTWKPSGAAGTVTESPTNQLALTPAMTNAMVDTGITAAAAHNLALERELVRRGEEYGRRFEGARRLTEVGDIDRAIREGQAELDYNELLASSKAANDAQLRPTREGTWVHGGNAGAAAQLGQLRREREQRTWQYFPDEARAGLRQRLTDTAAYQPPHVLAAAGIDPTLSQVLPLPPGREPARPYARGGQMLPLPPLPRYAVGGYSSGYGATPAPPSGIEAGQPGVSPETDETLTEQVDSERMADAMARIERRKQDALGRIAREREQKLAALAQWNDETLAELDRREGELTQSRVMAQSRLDLRPFAFGRPAAAFVG